MRQYIAVFLIFVLLIPTVAADGMTFRGDTQLFNLQPEKEQAGAIFYENGYENMLLSVSLDWNTTGNRSVWIFPVPAAPEDISIDMLKGYPYLHGKWLEEEYYDTILQTIGTGAAYALFPFSGPSVSVYFMPRHGGPLSADIQQDIQVYQHVEKMGLTSELVTAENADAIERYLSGKGIVLPDGSKEILNEYSGKKYSFVITSVSNVTEFRSQFRGIQYHYATSEMADMLSVFVRFPTERAYFPLKLTSAYGTRIIPVTITVNGWVTPIVPDTIRAGESIRTGDLWFTRAGTVTTYFKQGSDSWDAKTEYIYPELRKFTNGRELIPAIYTKVRIYTPSSNFTDDLWFENNPPVDVTIKDMIIQNKVLLGILIYLILSMLASLIAGLIVFRSGPVSKIWLIIHGLWNCATVIGLIYATRWRLNLPDHLAKRKKRYVIVFYLVFLFLLSIIGFLVIPDFIYYILLFVLIGTSAAIYTGVSHVCDNMYTLFWYGHGDLLSTLRELFIPYLAMLLCIIALAIFIWGIDDSLQVKK